MPGWALKLVTFTEHERTLRCSRLPQVRYRREAWIRRNLSFLEGGLLLFVCQKQRLLGITENEEWLTGDYFDKI